MDLTIMRRENRLLSLELHGRIWCPGVRPGTGRQDQSALHTRRVLRPCDWSPVRDDCAAQWRARCVVSRMQQALRLGLLCFTAICGGVVSRPSFNARPTAMN